jgi:hypothetical protein
MCFTWEIAPILVYLVSKLPQQNKCDNKTLRNCVYFGASGLKAPTTKEVWQQNLTSFCPSGWQCYHNAPNNPYHAPFIHTPHFAKATKIHTMILTVLIPSKNLNLLYNDNKVIEKVTLSFTSSPLFQQYPPSKEILSSLTMKCWNSAFNVQGSRVIIVVVQVRAAKVYVALAAQGKGKRGWNHQNWWKN